MNIGIDVYFLHSNSNTGIGNYVLNLLVELSKLDTKNRYYLYTPTVNNIDIANAILKNSNFKIIEENNLFRKSRRLWLLHYSFWRHVKRDKIDLFIGSGEYLPVFLPSNITKALIVYDVVFKIFPDAVPFESWVLYNTLFRYCVWKADYIFTISENCSRTLFVITFPFTWTSESFIIACAFVRLSTIFESTR